jgi:hypothetical protein
MAAVVLLSVSTAVLLGQARANNVPQTRLDVVPLGGEGCGHTWDGVGIIADATTKLLLVQSLVMNSCLALNVYMHCCEAVWLPFPH